MNNRSQIREWGIDPSWTLFLDRDGTINERAVGYIEKWESFRFLAQAIEAIHGFTKLFGRLIIVTNQQGIDKELITHEDLKDIHNRMIDVLEYYDGKIDAVYYEPSLAVYESPRRKPNIGMALDAQNDFPEIEFRKSVMIGDTLSDIEFGRNLGMKTVWIDNPMENHNRERILEICDVKVDSMFTFLSLINVD